MGNDLISRKDALSVIDDICTTNERELVIKSLAHTMLLSKSMVPTIDAAPVVHGRWRSIKAVGGPNYPYWDAKCSECGYTTKSTAGWLYCPHCGAKMDGDVNE